MNEPRHIKEKRLLNAAYERIAKLNIFEEERSRCVMFEKYKKPTVVIPEEEEVEFDFIDIILRGHGHTEICWYNSSGKLHSFNGMPSKISFGTYHWLTVEWHKNGIPFRKNNLPNLIEATSDFGMLNDEPRKEKITTTFTWLNEKGEPHSFNDMPGRISDGSISWYWNGENYRRFNHSGYELPCNIDKFGNMRFCTGKDDAPESVKYPLSARYYGKGALYNLNRYEKYVNWPIRQLLTM